VQAAPIIYAIRHGEKPADGANNLSSQGLARAQRLRQFFGKNSGFNIGYIVAQHPKKGLSTRLFLLWWYSPVTEPRAGFYNLEFRGSS
jgi:hypothetical protein